jgi:biotin synthase
MQPLALNLANSIFLGDYLTSEGQAGKADLEMIADAGFEVEGAGELTLPEHRVTTGGGCGSHAETGCGSHAETGCGSHADAGCGSHEGGGVCGSVKVAAKEQAKEEQPSEARTDLVAVRRRGAGTDLAPNA